MKYTAEEVRALFEAWAEENGYDVLRIEPDYNDGFTAAAWHGYQTAYAERIEADEDALPASLEQFREAIVFACVNGNADKWRRVLASFDSFAYRYKRSCTPPAQAAQGEASHGRCKACERATRAVCDGLDGNGLGCINAPPIDLAAVREVIAEIRRCAGNNNAKFHLTWADKLEAALQEKSP